MAFVRRERILQVGYPKVFWPGAPDLAVEVVSPGEIVEEVADYLAAGTLAVWVVKPKPQTITVHTDHRSLTVLTIDEDLDGGELLPGFRCRVADIFAS